MASILTGRLQLSKIPADIIRYDNNGNAFVWVDVAERREPSQYGDTHYVSIYDKEHNQKIYLGDLRPRDIGGATADNSARPSAFPPQRPAAPAPSPEPGIPNWRPMNSARDEATPTPVPPAPGPLDPHPDDLPF